MNSLGNIIKDILAALPSKAVISKPSAKESRYKKIIISQKGVGFQAEKFTDKQVFHENLSLDDACKLITELMEKDFLQLNAWDSKYEHIMLISKKGKLSYKKKPAGFVRPINTAHNREKKYLLPEGTIIPPLIDMGIFTKDGKIVSKMYDKFRQINRFIEIIDDAVKSRGNKPLNIIDFGCGKSYLTFILYYYLTEIRHTEVNITGLDLKADVIKECNAAAVKYGYKNLHFEQGDINGCDYTADMVITLHACDTATDYALYNAICRGAELIFSVPCCQHEVNSQIKSENLSLLTRYGIIKERTSALITDAIRANLLEAQGYKTQLLEFVDMEHTPKNILIRAVKRQLSSETRDNALKEVLNIMDEFNLNPTLYRLLYEKEQS